AHEPGIEGELRASGAVDLGQRPGRAQRECPPVAGHGGYRVGQAVAPDLKRAQLGNAVLDVVEGVEKDVQLTIPPGEPLLLEPFPVQLPLEPRTNPKPGAIARIGVVSLATGV